MAVLGTGIMGSAMARNLVRAGLHTTVWDRTPAAVAVLAEAGAHAAASPEQADLALAAAGDAPPPVLAALSTQWHAAVEAGLGREDVSAARVALGSHGVSARASRSTSPR